MKHTKHLSALFGLLSVLLMGTILLAASFRNAAPLLPDSMEEAEAQSQALMDALCAGNYAAAEALLRGSPTLSPVADPSNPLSKTLWEIYGSSLSYEFRGGCYADDYGVYRDVTVTMADITAMLNEVQSHSAVLLVGKAAADPNNAYNPDGSYREEFMMNALAEETALLNPADYLTTRDLTLQLDVEGRQWVIHPDRALLDLLAGGMGGA